MVFIEKATLIKFRGSDDEMRGKKRIKKGCKLDKTDFELSIWGKRLIRLTFGAMTPLFNYLNYLLMSIALYILNLKTSSNK